VLCQLTFLKTWNVALLLQQILDQSFSSFAIQSLMFTNISRHTALLSCVMLQYWQYVWPESKVFPHTCLWYTQLMSSLTFWLPWTLQISLLDVMCYAFIFGWSELFPLRDASNVYRFFIPLSDWIHCCRIIPINQPTRCDNFPSLLLDVYVRPSVFQASSRPSSGAYQLQ
jgi:hypothetical protein